MADYSSEAPLKEADRKQQERRAKTRKRTIYALTVVCRDEADQKALFPQVRRQFAGRRIRVVVS